MGNDGFGRFLFFLIIVALGFYVHMADKAVDKKKAQLEYIYNQGQITLDEFVYYQDQISLFDTLFYPQQVLGLE